MADFYDSETAIPPLAATFNEFGLSNPVCKSLAQIDFVEPTPIQSSMIPLALQGRDICASAVTGSGKTAAFLIPTIERLLRDATPEPTIRCIILSPTRELANQTFSVLKQFIKYTGLTALLLTGGLLSPAAEIEKILTNPDFIVATPGRLVDHLKNSDEIDLSQLLVFILDEADRLLDEGFMNQLEEIIHDLPETRQNLLVTATLTSPVERLADLALHNPVRIALDDLFSTSSSLRQEFVPVSKEQRLAALLAICSRLCTKRTVIFFMKKKTAHRVYALFKALEMPALELHGDMPQVKRYEALTSFSSGSVEFLLASDVAARGLDIPHLENVINFNLPKQMSQYVHRVGRTARIGNVGTAVSLVGDNDRDLMKAIIQKSKNPVHKRIIPDHVLEATQTRIDEVQEKVEEILEKEAEEKEFKIAEKLIERAKEIDANPLTAQEREKRAFVSKEKLANNDVRKIQMKVRALKNKSTKESKESEKENKKDFKDNGKEKGKKFNKGRKDFKDNGKRGKKRFH